jgi:hypothetical protein
MRRMQRMLSDIPDHESLYQLFLTAITGHYY